MFLIIFLEEVILWRLIDSHLIIFIYLAADSGRAMQEQMATGGGMMGPQADPQKAFEVRYFQNEKFCCVFFYNCYM